MPYTKLSIREGFYTEDTRVDSSGRWIDGNHIRFVTDIPEKIGGWQKYNSSTFLGICRSIIYWPTFEDNRLYAFGTNLKLYTIFNGSYWDITPYETGGILRNPFTTTMSSAVVNVLQPNHGLVNGDLVLFQNVTPFAGITFSNTVPYAITYVDADNYTITVSSSATSAATGGGVLVLYAFYYILTNPFSTTISSSIVNVNQTNHGRLVGDYITFLNSSSVGGINPNGTWIVLAVVDANNYTFDSGTLATSTAGPGGGTVNYLYELNPGSANTDVGYGYGVSTYDSGSYGTPRGNQGVILNYPRIWSLDIWSDDLIASPRDEGIYYWPHAIATPVTTRAALIPNAPAQTKTVAVWPESSIVVAFGCTDTLGNYNPMNVRWSAVGDYNNWALTDLSNFPGEFGLTNGNEIIGVAKMRGQMLIATDTSLYSMYTNGPNFEFRSLGEARILSPNAIVEVNGVVYMMGDKQFYVYDGTIRVIKCEVRRHVFEDINLQQGFKVFGALNSGYNEVWWFYQSAAGTENDRYVIYNFQKNIWYFGELNRTAFLDTGEVGIYPIAAGSDNYMYNQEVGVDADGVGMDYFLESADMVIDQRNRFVYVKNIIPDLLESNKNIILTFTSRRFPQDPGYISRTYTITPGTDVIGTRTKGGQVSFSYQNDPIDSLGATFQVGDLEVQYLPTGVK